MDTCIFCKIANGDPAELVWSNDVAAAFNDLYPKSPVHVLVVPKQHIENLDHLDDPKLAGQLLLAVREVAHQAGLKSAWRMGVNNGSSVGQSVPHLHFHIRGGEKMTD
ncbi:MAG TPA: HIT domain-containing protein [Candidatus Saccharimonadia bacterium]|nr:HIT domain-containing protein [Candidatus Saccharimonadia bacterium]